MGKSQAPPRTKEVPRRPRHANRGLHAENTGQHLAFSSAQKAQDCPGVEGGNEGRGAVQMEGRDRKIVNGGKERLSKK